MPTGTSVHYVSGSGNDHVDLPRVDDGYRQTHQQHTPRSTGIDFDALAPTCSGCSKRSGTVNFSTGLCAVCAPPAGKTQKPPTAAKQVRRTTRPRAVRAVEIPAAVAPTYPETIEPVVELEPVEHAVPTPATLATPPGDLPRDPGRRLVLELDDVRTTLIRAHGHPDATIGALRDLALQAVGVLRVRLDELHPPGPVPVAVLVPTPQTSSQPAATPRARAARSTRASTKPVDEAAIVREYVEDLDSSPVIADRHGIRPKRVRDILDRHNVQRRDDRATNSGGHAKPLTEYDQDQVATMIDRYKAGESSVQIGDSLGCSHRVVVTILKKAGVELRPPASIARATVIDEPTAATITRRYAEGESSNDLAAEYRIRAERCRQIAVDHGVPIRKRGDGSHHLQQLVHDLGVSAKDVKVWAVEQGLLARVTRGSVAARITAAYAAAHQPVDAQEAIA